ncbi:unnamed protein product [Ambrosiozyma monospora]|uniref:Unnamed protein product n=1 Tax=Ambrosiozyma monospora TaxID=43982 RepID=A0ACB5T3C2_AMBMO|nr:unnamed protein product [Ambrosiozyma monospora]
MNGVTPVIAKYLDAFGGNNSKYIVWPVDLCFVQFALDSELLGQPKQSQNSLHPTGQTHQDTVPTQQEKTSSTTTTAGVTDKESNTPSTTASSSPDQLQPKKKFEMLDPLDLVSEFIEANEIHLKEEEELKSKIKQEREELAASLKKEREQQLQQHQISQQTITPGTTTTSNLGAGTLLKEWDTGDIGMLQHDQHGFGITGESVSSGIKEEPVVDLHDTGLGDDNESDHDDVPLPSVKLEAAGAPVCSGVGAISTAGADTNVGAATATGLVGEDHDVVMGSGSDSAGIGSAESSEPVGDGDWDELFGDDDDDDDDDEDEIAVGDSDKPMADADESKSQPQDQQSSVPTTSTAEQTGVPKLEVKDNETQSSQQQPKDSTEAANPATGTSPSVQKNPQLSSTTTATDVPQSAPSQTTNATTTLLPPPSSTAGPPTTNPLYSDPGAPSPGTFQIFAPSPTPTPSPVYDQPDQALGDMRLAKIGSRSGSGYNSPAVSTTSGYGYGSSASGTGFGTRHDSSSSGTPKDRRNFSGGSNSGSGTGVAGAGGPGTGSGPGATPKDRRKSIFAPLNFNPLIEKDIDSKYSTGGKFFVKGSNTGSGAPGAGPGPGCPGSVPGVSAVGVASGIPNSSGSTGSSGKLATGKLGFSALPPNSATSVRSTYMESLMDGPGGVTGAAGVVRTTPTFLRKRRFEDVIAEDDDDDLISDSDEDQATKNGDGGDEEDDDEDDEDDEEGEEDEDDDEDEEMEDDEMENDENENANNNQMDIDTHEENDKLGLTTKPAPTGLGISGTAALLKTNTDIFGTPTTAISSNNNTPNLGPGSPTPTSNLPVTSLNSNEIQNWLYWILRGPSVSSIPPKFLSDSTPSITPKLSKKTITAVLPVLQEFILYSRFQDSPIFVHENDLTLLNSDRESPSMLGNDLECVLNKVFPGVHRLELTSLLEPVRDPEPPKPFDSTITTSVVVMVED